ncbi:lamin tail domain-containing protein [Streptomyces sp. NPDC056835]|uniref:lamin tail domain-containing protein n=1 Tax=Streptomyces sp. NPDC056835 TaxID=3345956 RepID=UPI0036A94F05
MSASVSGRRTAALVLAAGALVGAAALPASATGHQAPRPSVVLGKIQYDSPGRDTGSNRSLNGEWVEVTNKSRRAVNLDGWPLSDRDGNRYTFDLRLAGRSTVGVHTGDGRDTRTAVYQDNRSYIWENRGDTATLRNDRGRKVDSESWGRGSR